jgi:hypothetical protein
MTDKAPHVDWRGADLRADVFDGLMTRLEAFGDEFERLARSPEQKALAESFGDLVSEVSVAIKYIAEATRQYGPANTCVVSLGDQFKAVMDGKVRPENQPEQPAKEKEGRER